LTGLTLHEQRRSFKPLNKLSSIDAFSFQAALGARGPVEHPVLLLEPVELFDVELVGGARQIEPLLSDVLVTSGFEEVVYRVDEAPGLVVALSAPELAEVPLLSLQYLGECLVAELVAGSNALALGRSCNCVHGCCDSAAGAVRHKCELNSIGTHCESVDRGWLSAGPDWLSDGPD
jgi:hypothetical protein